jgi:hypothetical protein
MSDDYDLIIFLAGTPGGGCSLDSSPKKNWVEKSGGLPNYICKIAKGIMKSGKSKSAAIAIAVNQVKKWAAGGGDVDADTKAKAAKAVAQWTALKAKNKAKKLVAASHPNGEDKYIMLSNVGSFNTDLVRRAYNGEQSRLRKTHREEFGRDDMYDPIPYTYIKELWTDYIIVEVETPVDDKLQLLKVPYGVQGSTVHFGESTPVTQEYVEVIDPDEDLSESEIALLGDLLNLSTSPLDRISQMAAKL